MATQTVNVSQNVDAIATFRSADTLVINNGAVVTVNTNQDKFWSGITINNGKLRIENTSTSQAIRFLMGRSSGTTAFSCTPASGLGSIEIEGNWIEIGVGDGTAGQSFTMPYTDHVAALWVETASGSGVYEIWTNTVARYGGAPKHMWEGLPSFGKGVKGKVFYQPGEANADSYIVLAGATTANTSRVIGVTSTAGMTVGATIIGTGIPANAVIEKILTSNTLETNAASTVTGSTTITVYNTYTAQLTDQAEFGDGVHGNVVPNGAKVRVPNIMVTGVFGTNIGTATDGLNFVMTNSGNFSAKKCLFDHCHNTFTQPTQMLLHDCGFSYNQNIVKAYGIDLNGVGFSELPQRMFLSGGYWTYGASYSIVATSGPITLQYVSGTVRNLVYQQHKAYQSAASNPASGAVAIKYADGLVVEDLRVVFGLGHYQYTTGARALCLYYVNNSTFDGLELHGLAPLIIYASSDNLITNLGWSWLGVSDHASPARPSNFHHLYCVDPTTGEDFVDGQTYYLKQVMVTDGLGATVVPSREYPFTPYAPSTALGASLQISTGSNSVVLTWGRRDPTHTAPSYEVFRSTTAGCPVRDISTRQFSTNSPTVLTFTDSGAVNDTRYYYVLRKHTSAGVYEDYAVQEAIPSALPVIKNYLLQSQVPSNASWTKTGCSFSATVDFPGVACGPGVVIDSAFLATVSAANATIAQTVTGLTIAQTYTASVWVRFPGWGGNGSAGTTTTGMRLSFGTSLLDFDATKEWVRQEVSFVATATSHTFSLRFNTIGTRVAVQNFQVNDGATALPNVKTTTAAVTAEWELGSVTARSHSMAGEDHNGGVALFIPTVTGLLGYAVSFHIGQTAGFTPTQDNMVMWSHTSSPAFTLTVNSSRNQLRGITQLGAGGQHAQDVITFSSSSSDNVLEDLVFNEAGGCYSSATTLHGIVRATADANRNLIKNMGYKNRAGYSSYGRVTYTDNTANGTTLANCRVEPSAIYVEPLNNDMIIKGLGGGNASAADAATTWAMGAIGDGVPVTFTGVYDTHFAELYHTDTTGALNIFFTPSTKAAPPYTLTGTAAFSSTGYLFLQAPGDSITYTWPHKILGVSGFRNIAHKCLTADLGTSTDVLEAALLEFQIDSGSGYSAWAEATPAALSALTLSATDGFYLKLRLTVRQFFKFSGQTNNFVIGETIRQLTSGATARVAAVYDLGATGTCVVDTVTGTWTNTATLDIVRDSDSQARCTDTVLTNGFVLGPSFNSSIRGLQIHTTIDQTVLYPSDSSTLTITGLPTGCDVVVLDAGSDTIFDQRDSLAGTSYTYTYFGTQTVDIGLIKPGYVPYYIRGFALGAGDSSIPVSLMLDRTYQ